MSSPCRDDFRIWGYRFGEGAKTVAIVGPMRGDEIQQQYICAKMVKKLSLIEQSGGIAEGKSILVIPSCNPFSMNVSHRFWSMDGTDINRMFPGYSQGETTQRIAAAIFSEIQDYAYGIQLASFYLSGSFVPHVRLLQTGYEDVEGAKMFGMPLVTIYKPLPFDTVLLNYNWQLWETKAFSLYSGVTRHLDEENAQQTVQSILRFLYNTGTTTYCEYQAGFASPVVHESSLVNIRASKAGIFTTSSKAGMQVERDEVIARIIHPYCGEILEQVKSPADGIIYFQHDRPLCLQNAILFKILVAR